MIAALRRVAGKTSSGLFRRGPEADATKRRIAPALFAFPVVFTLLYRRESGCALPVPLRRRVP